jgi:transcriptional regulator GlxA family with amidase domain
MRHIGFAVSANCSLMGLAAAPAFEVANIALGQPVYALHFLSESGGAVLTSAGAKIQTEHFDDRKLDTLMVCGGLVVEPSTPALIGFLQKAAARYRRVASICIGAFPLAEAGVLNGRRATTHWLYAEELRTRFPKVTVEMDRVFVQDGPVWSSAGMTAGIDLAVALVEADLGDELARSVAKKLVMYHRRVGGQSQFSTLLELEPKSDRIQTVLTYAKRNLSKTLSVEELAKVAHLSPRQFSRLFRTETGRSPAKAIEGLRAEEARIMIEGGEHSIDEVAEHTGFGDRDRMRRAFRRAFGQPPQFLKRKARLNS